MWPFYLGHVSHSRFCFCSLFSHPLLYHWMVIFNRVVLSRWFYPGSRWYGPDVIIPARSNDCKIYFLNEVSRWVSLLKQPFSGILVGHFNTRVRLLTFYFHSWCLRYNTHNFSLLLVLTNVKVFTSSTTASTSSNSSSAITDSTDYKCNNNYIRTTRS